MELRERNTSDPFEGRWTFSSGALRARGHGRNGTIMGVGIAIGIVQVVIAFLCVREGQRQDRLTNGRVLAAAAFGT